MSEAAARLAERLEQRKAIVGVIGLGYVGLPLALSCTQCGLSVVGFDIDQSKAEQLNQGRSYIKHIEDLQVASARASDRFTATNNFGRLTEPDVLLICVPTPLTAGREPDLSFIESTAGEISACLRPGQLIVLESTTYPGTTEDLLRTRLESSGLVCGIDFFVGFSPEREDPGNKSFSVGEIPKIVAGVDDASASLTETFYDLIAVKTVRVSNCRTAEAAKLTENIFRAVNIALVNELKMIYDRMDIDIWEVLEAASTKPFGFMRFEPGPGWGGHCIPIDPFYLAWKARECGAEALFIEQAGRVNVGMTDFVMGKLENALSTTGKPLAGAKILVLGLAYKRDVADTRESPAFPLIDRLLSAGAEVLYHDPHLPVTPKVRSWPDLPQLKCSPLDAGSLAACDAVLLVTDHSGIDYDLVAKHAPLVVDTRGVYRKSRPNIVKA